MYVGGTVERPLHRLTKLPGSTFRLLKGQAGLATAALLFPSALRPPRLAACGGGVEGVHLKDERSCAFKRAVSPLPHAPPQPHTLLL